MVDSVDDFKAIKMQAYTIVAAACFASLGLYGCGPPGPAVQFVEGLVLLDGKPLDGAVIGLTPIEGKGLPATARTDSAGLFRPTSTRGGRPQAGAMVGEYVLTVSKTGYDFGGKPPPAEGDTTTVVPIRSLVPDAYGDSARSPLRLSVKPGEGGKDPLRFELESSFVGAAAPNSR